MQVRLEQAWSKWITSAAQFSCKLSTCIPRLVRDGTDWSSDKRDFICSSKKKYVLQKQIKQTSKHMCTYRYILN